VEKALAAALARGLGLAFDEAVVLGEGMSVLVHRETRCLEFERRNVALLQPGRSLTTYHQSCS